MSRSGVPSEFSNNELTAFYAVDLAFDTGTAYIWNGVGDLVIGGNTYSGTGSLLGISPIEEDPEISAKGATVTIEGVSSTALSYALNENYQGRSLIIRVGAIQSNGTIQSYIVFSGLMDTMSIADEGDSCTISIAAESRLVDLERARIRRYTSEDQKQLYSGDLGFDFVASLQDKEIEWGR